MLLNESKNDGPMVMPYGIVLSTFWEGMTRASVWEASYVAAFKLEPPTRMNGVAPVLLATALMRLLDSATGDPLAPGRIHQNKKGSSFNCT